MRDASPVYIYFLAKGRWLVHVPRRGSQKEVLPGAGEEMRGGVACMVVEGRSLSTPPSGRHCRPSLYVNVLQSGPTWKRRAVRG